MEEKEDSKRGPLALLFSRKRRLAGGMGSEGISGVAAGGAAFPSPSPERHLNGASMAAAAAKRNVCHRHRQTYGLQATVVAASGIRKTYSIYQYQPWRRHPSNYEAA